MRAIARTLALLASIGFVPTAAFAQAVIAGSVKDASGAVLPGVTVEAASPALIEKVRAAVSDGTGQYRIEDLRPGTYTVTFTLPGFSTYKREGIELTGSFTATVNADLKVGALAETITVTGETPVVDVQSAQARNDAEQRRPQGRSRPSAATTRWSRWCPASITNLNDVVDGNGDDAVSHPRRAGQRGPSHDRRAQRRESDRRQPAAVVRRGRRQRAGSLVHDLRRSGGVRDRRPGDERGAEDRRQLRLGRGLRQLHRRTAVGRQLHRRAAGRRPRGADAAPKVYDLNGSFGGPIKKDRVWYFVNARTQGSTRMIANVYYNQNAGDPTKWLYRRT